MNNIEFSRHRRRREIFFSPQALDIMEFFEIEFAPPNKFRVGGAAPPPIISKSGGMPPNRDFLNSPLVTPLPKSPCYLFLFI